VSWHGNLDLPTCQKYWQGNRLVTWNCFLASFISLFYIIVLGDWIIIFFSSIFSQHGKPMVVIIFMFMTFYLNLWFIYTLKPNWKPSPEYV
jgi:low temperature requirement protein LtrA